MRTNRVFRCILLLAIFVSTSFAYDFPNGDFEDNFDNWRYYAVGGAEASFTIVNDAYSGNNAASYEVTAFPGGDCALDRDSTRIAVAQGDAVNISFASKKISTGSTRIMLSVAEFNSAGAFLGLQDNFYFAPANVYTELSTVKFISNATTAYINIAFRIVDDFGLTTVGHYYIDAVTITEGELLYNGGFEDGTNGWRAYAVGGGTGNFGLSADSYEGSSAFSFEITAGGGDHGLDRWGSRFPASSGQVFGISAATKKISTDNTTLKVYVSEWADDVTFLGQSEFALTSGVGDYAVSNFYYPVSNPSTVKLNINFGIFDEYGLKSAGHYLVDDVTLAESVRLFNGSFEAGFTGWRGYAVGGSEGTYTISSDAYEGNSAALMSITNGSGDQALDRELAKISVDPNEVMTFSFASKRLSAEERTVRFSVAEFDVNNAYLGNYNGLFDFKPQTGSYEVYDYTYTVTNPACVKVNIGFTIFEADLSAKSTGEILIDDIKLINPQYVTNYGFEKNYDYWRYYAVGGAVVDYTISEDAYEGSYAALMTVTTAGVDQALDRNDSKISAMAGDDLRVSFAAKNASGDDTLLLLTVSEFDSAGNYLAKYGSEFFAPSIAYGVMDYYYTVQDASAALVNISFTIFNNDGTVKSTGSYLLDNIKVVKGNGLNVSDLNYDLSVNTDDLQLLTSDWLAGDITPGIVATVDDFEGYADQAALDAKWQEFYWSGFNGSTTSSTVTLLTDSADAFAGNQALRWVYDANDISGNGQDYTDIVLTLDSTIDLRTAKSVKININRHVGNSQENLLYVKFFEGAVDVANLAGQGIWLTRAEGSTYSPTGWTQWTASLDELVGADKSGLDQVSAILLGCWSPEADGTSGTGTIDIDNIVVEYEDVCNGYSPSDANNDCTTNLLDMVELANNWLTESLYY